MVKAIGYESWEYKIRDGPGIGGALAHKVCP
jgi:hypothetical protein